MALEFFAGCCGGAAGIIVGHPLDTVKVRLQTQSATAPVYRGTFHCIVSVIKQESFFGLYKGILPPVLGIAANGALLFGVYGNLKPFVSGSWGQDALWAHFGAGCAAGAARTLVAAPTELVKVRMQIDTSNWASAASRPTDWQVFKSIYRSEGIRRGVYRGWFVTMARDIPGIGVFFATNEAVLRWRPNSSSFDTLMAGGVAGLACWTICFPMDVIKSRIQSDVARQYSGAWDCARKALARDGYRVFLQGLNSTLLRAFPVNATVLTVVNWIHELSSLLGIRERPSRREI